MIDKHLNEIEIAYARLEKQNQRLFAAAYQLMGVYDLCLSRKLHLQETDLEHMRSVLAEIHSGLA